VLFELLALRPLFKRGTPFETLLAVQKETVPKISSIRNDAPRALDTIIDRATTKWPSERYDSAQAFRHALELLQMQLGEPATAADISNWMHRIFAPNVELDDSATQTDLPRSSRPPLFEK
jgi:hypothetical protein